jgi:hypothetical protein
MGYRVEKRIDNGAATYITNYIIVGLATMFALPFLGDHGDLTFNRTSLMFLTYALGNLIAGYMHQHLKPFSRVTDVAWISSEVLVLVSNVLLLSAILAPLLHISNLSLGVVLFCVVGGTIYSERFALVLGGGISIIASICLIRVAYHLAYWLPQTCGNLPQVAWVGATLNTVYAAAFIFSKPSKWLNFGLHMLAIGYYSTLFAYFVITGSGG